MSARLQLIIAFSLSCLFAVMLSFILYGVLSNGRQLKNNANRLIRLETGQVAATAKRFTADDAQQMKEQNDKRFIYIEKRINKLEQKRN